MLYTPLRFEKHGGGVMIRPHGGKLVNRVATGCRREKLLEEVEELPKIALEKDLAVDVENIAHGVFSPLEGFMTRNDYLSVLNRMRLENDLPWTIPIVLDVSSEELKAKGIKEGDTVALVFDGKVIAVMEVEDIYEYDKEEFAVKVFKTDDLKHPSVFNVFKMKDRLVGGKIELLNKLSNPFSKYTLQPTETRALFRKLGWKTIVGFQTRNAPHLGHEFVQKSALLFVDGLFVNPIVGWKKRGDFKDEVVLRSYEVLIDKFFPKHRVVLAVLRTKMRYAGAREAVFHAIVRKNFGCTHFIVGRDHAGVGNYYKPYEAQEIFEEFPDLEITPLFFKQFHYCKKCYGYVSESVCPHSGDDVIPPSGTKIRKMLMSGEIPPKEMMRPEIAEVILSFDKPFVE